MEYIDYEELHRDTINKLHQMVNSGKITVETACGICADFVPEPEDERIRKELIAHIKWCEDSGYCAKEEMTRWITFLEKQGKQKPVEPQQDMLSQEKYAKAVDECIYGEQKPAEWSEKDENLFRCAIDAVREESKVRTDGCLDEEVGEMVTNFLKSLKDRYTWKPSDEQMDAFYTYLYHPQYIDNSDDYRIKLVISLYEQLKKIKG